MEWTIRIPNWLPLSVNKLLGMHWGKRSKAKQVGYDIVAAYAKRGGVTAAKNPRSIHCHVVYPPGSRRLDHDNMNKVFLDSCVKAGIIYNDSPGWLTKNTWSDSRGEELVTYITITEE